MRYYKKKSFLLTHARVGEFNFREFGYQKGKFAYY